MNIGLDYDGTCTEDIELFLAFIKLARARGHQVYLVTMRYPSEVNDPNFPNKAVDKNILNAVSGLICTGREAKRKVTDKLGIKINVWIDDNPLAVEKHAREIWGWCTPEGVIVKNAEEAEEQRSKGLISEKQQSDALRTTLNANEITGTTMLVNAFKSMLPEEKAQETTLTAKTKAEEIAEAGRAFMKSIGDPRFTD